MRPQLIVTVEAQREIQEAFDWYEAQSSGLGERLLRSIDDSFEIIADFPESFPIRRKNYHECRVRDFPYLIIYRFVRRQIIVHQLFHGKRRPGKKVK